jgi:hypothetical protein
LYFQGFSMSANNQLFVLAEQGGYSMLEVWSVRENGGVVNNLRKKGQMNLCCGLAVSLDGSTLVVGKNNGGVKVYDISKTTDLQVAPVKGEIDSTEHGPIGRISGLLLSDDAERLLIYGREDFQVIRLSDGAVVRKMGIPRGHPHIVTTDLKRVIYYGWSGSQDTGSALYLFDIENGRPLGKLTDLAPEANITAMTTMGPEDSLVLGFSDGAIKIFAADAPRLSFTDSRQTDGMTSTGVLGRDGDHGAPSDSEAMARLDRMPEPEAHEGEQRGLEAVPLPTLTVAVERTDEPPPRAPLARRDLSGLQRYDGYNSVASDGRGGWVIVGAQDLEQPGHSMARFRLVGADGAMLADRTFLPKGSISAGFVDVVEMDGEFIAAGWARSPGAETDDCLAARLTAAGEERWLQSLGGPGHERCYFVELLSGGDVLVGGRVEDDATGKGNAAGAIWRLDPETGALRDKGYAALRAAGVRRSAFQDAAFLPDGGIFLVGWATDPQRGDDDVWLARRDVEGPFLSERRIGGAGPDLATAVVPGAGADEVIVVGYTTGNGRKATSGFVLALAGDGTTSWMRELDVGAGGNDKLLDAVVRPDGTIVAVGTASRDAKAPLEGWVLRMDGSGRTLSERLVSEPPGGRFNSIAGAGDGALALVGTARGPVDVDAWTLLLEGSSDPIALAAEVH